MATKTELTEMKVPEGYTRGFRNNTGVWFYEKYSNWGGLTSVGKVKRELNVDPDWRKKVSAGVDASLPYYRDGWVIRSLPKSQVRIVKPGVPYDIIGEESHTWISVNNQWNYTVPRTDAALADIALTRLKRKLQEQLGNAKLLAPLAELRELSRLYETASLFSYKGLAGLVDIRKDLRRTSGATAQKLMNRASELWLTWSLGVKPMLSDIEAVTIALTHWFDQHRSVRLTGSANKQWLSAEGPNSTSSAYGTDFQCRAAIEQRLSYKYICGFDLLVNSSSDYQLAQHLGFGFTDVVPAAWELIPFSWVWDYFFTIGAFLDDTFYSPPGMTKYVVECRKFTAEFHWTNSYSPQLPYKTFVQTVGHGKGTYFQFQRKVLGNLPHTALRFKTQKEITANADNRLLNLLSILGAKKRF